MTDDNSMRDNACRKIFASTAHRLSTCQQWRAVNKMDGHDDEEALRYAVSAIDEIRQSNLPMASAYPGYDFNAWLGGLEVYATIDGFIYDGGSSLIALNIVGGYQPEQPGAGLRRSITAAVINKRNACDVQWADIFVDRGEWTMHQVEPATDDDIAAVATRIADRDRICAGHQCKSCDHAATCPAMLREIEAMPIDTAIDDLNWRSISELLDKADLVSTWIKAVKRRAEELAAANALPGWSLKPGRPTRVWTDDEQAARVMADQARRKGIDGFVPWTQKIKSPAAAEKELGKAKAVKAALSQVVKYAPGRPALKKEDAE